MKLIIKSHRFVPFGSNLTQYGCQIDIPVAHWFCHDQIALTRTQPNQVGSNGTLVGHSWDRLTQIWTFYDVLRECLYIVSRHDTNKVS